MPPLGVGATAKGQVHADLDLTQGTWSIQDRQSRRDVERWGLREGKGPHRAEKRRPFLRGTGPDTPLPFNGALCTGAAAACCEMIIFCFLPVHGLMFSSSSEEKEWEKIVAFIPPCVPQKLPFYESPCAFVSISRILRAGRPLPHRASLFPNLLAFGKSRKTGLAF